MKVLYKIVGIHGRGNEVRLSLKNEMIKKKLNPMDALKDTQGFLQQIQESTHKEKETDHLTIPVDLWKERNYTLGNTIEVEI